MAGVTLFGFTILKSHTEREIHKLFEHYTTTMTAQKLKMSDDITEWGDAFMRSIYKYVTKQKYLLEQEFTNQIQHLNKTSQQFIDELRVYEQISNTEQIDELLDRCKALQFELTPLEYHGQTIPFIAIPNKEESVVINKDGFDVFGAESNKFDDNSLVQDNSGTENSMNTYPNVTSTSVKQINAQITRTNSKNVSDCSINNDNDHPSFTARSDSFVEKCPMCFMIFPSTMTAPDRSQHVQEHYRDD